MRFWGIEDILDLVIKLLTIFVFEVLKVDVKILQFFADLMFGARDEFDDKLMGSIGGDMAE